MRRYVDLHMHTHFSDGTGSPQQVLELVKAAGIRAFSVTDHDTLEGYHVTRALLSENDPELVTGLELSVTVDDSDMHILAYLFDPDNRPLNAALEQFQNRRQERGRLMVNRLNDLGMDISYEDVRRQSGGVVIGRPHVARAMVENRHIREYEEAFRKFIGTDGPAYVPKMNFKPNEAIDLIHGAGGLAVLAHPGIDEKDKYLEMLVGLGLDGLEVYHPSHSKSQIDRYKHLADRYRLGISGGSDFHGSGDRYDRIGTGKIPYACLEQLKKKKTERQP